MVNETKKEEARIGKRLAVADKAHGGCVRGGSSQCHRLLCQS